MGNFLKIYVLIFKDFYEKKVKQLKIAAAKTLVMEGQVKRSEGKGVPIHPATDRLGVSQHWD